MNPTNPILIVIYSAPESSHSGSNQISSVAVVVSSFPLFDNLLPYGLIIQLSSCEIQSCSDRSKMLGHQTFRLGRVFAIIGHEKFHAPHGKASTVVFLASILQVLPLSS